MNVVELNYLHCKHRRLEAVAEVANGNHVFHNWVSNYEDHNLSI